jgi:hypothetical protein
METLPVNTDLDNCFVTPPGGTRTLLNALLNGGTVAPTLAVQTVTAAGSTQATAQPVTGGIVNLATVAAGTGINTPPVVAGLFETIVNSGANTAILYPPQGDSTSTINGLPGTLGVGIPPGAIVQVVGLATGVMKATADANPKQATYIANNASAAATLAATSFVGQELAVIDMTGSIGAGAALTLPTVAAMQPAMSLPDINTGMVVRIKNSGAGAGAWTLTAVAANHTIVGTATIAQNTWRDYEVTFVNAGSISFQNIGAGVSP